LAQVTLRQIVLSLFHRWGRFCNLEANAMLSAMQHQHLLVIAGAVLALLEIIGVVLAETGTAPVDRWHAKQR
jgi:hypothetical protein